MDLKTKGFTTMTQEEMETTEGGLKALHTIVMGIHAVFGNLFGNLFYGLFAGLGVDMSGGGDTSCSGGGTDCSDGYHDTDCEYY